MRLDTTYIDTIFSAFNDYNVIGELVNCQGFRTIQKHALITGNEFCIAQIRSALKGSSNAGYGLQNLVSNLDDIKKLYYEIIDNWVELEIEIVNQLKNIFPHCDVDNSTVCLNIGYDIGIGIDDTACINLNCPLFFHDIKEFVSIVIHELAHTIYEKNHPLNFDISSRLSIKRLVDELIQYEGVGIFSAYHYRQENKLPSQGSITIEDYHENPNSIEMMTIYLKLQHMVDNPLQFDFEDLLEQAFGNRLAHRLGYIILKKIFTTEGLSGVQEAAQMPNTEFVIRYLVE